MTLEKKSPSRCPKQILAPVCLCLGNVILGHLMAVLTEPLINGLLNAHCTEYTVCTVQSSTIIPPSCRSGPGKLTLLSNSITLEIAKNVYETSHLIHAQISLGCQQSITDTPTECDLRSFTQGDLQPVRIPRECLATITGIPACQDLGKALGHLQNATGVTRTPTSLQPKQNDDVFTTRRRTRSQDQVRGWMAERQSPLKKR